MENVLIVDDEEDILQLMAEAVSRWGYNPIIARNGEDAFEKVQNLPVDLILTDVRMPKVDGITLLQKVKDVNPNTSVIVFTGYPAIQSAVDALKSGAYDYLVKPVDLAELKSKINRALREKRLEGTYGILKSVNWALIISIPIWLLLAWLLVRSL
ncbi:MAG: response regulator [Calditrichaeota bacterium]|nr:MAG: response regulator [Calditrichota bacterium]